MATELVLQCNATIVAASVNIVLLWRIGWVGLCGERKPSTTATVCETTTG